MPDKKQLLILTSSYPSDISDGRAAGGHFIKDIVSELSNAANITVLTQHTETGPFEKIEGKISVIHFPWRGDSRPLSTLHLPNDFFLILSILIAGIKASVNQIRNKNIDHVVSMWALPCGLWALFLKKVYNIPYTVWCFGADIWNYQNSRLACIILKLVLKNADKVYADGFELTNAVNNIAQVGCTYLPSSRYVPMPENQISLKPEGVRHYLFIGRYHPNKGPDILIQAIHLLSSDIRSKIHCHFFGGGPMEEELKQLIMNLDLENTVTLNGFIGETKLAEVLFAIDTVIIPSRKDTISVMVSAALHMNKSIIASDVGDMGDILKKYNVGHIVSANSPESIAQGIRDDLLCSGDCNNGRSGLLELLNISNAATILLDGMTSRETV